MNYCVRFYRYWCAVLIQWLPTGRNPLRWKIRILTLASFFQSAKFFLGVSFIMEDSPDCNCIDICFDRVDYHKVILF